jgi:hypothetical protein
MDNDISNDLIATGTTRTLDMMDRMLQLIDEDYVAYALIASVATNAVDRAAQMLVRNFKARNQRVPSHTEAVAMVFMQIADALGVDWRIEKEKPRKPKG